MPLPNTRLVLAGPGALQPLSLHKAFQIVQIYQETENIIQTSAENKKKQKTDSIRKQTTNGESRLVN